MQIYGPEEGEGASGQKPCGDDPKYMDIYVPEVSWQIAKGNGLGLFLIFSGSSVCCLDTFL